MEGNQTDNLQATQVPDGRRRILILSMTAGVVVLGVIIGWYVFQSGKKHTGYNGQDNTPFKVLLRKNPDFAEGDRLTRSGEYDAAIQAYERALTHAQDLVQEAQIKFKIANAVEKKENYTEAITLFKEIAANNAYYNTVRAYAVQRLGIIFYTYGYGRPYITEEIFKGEPYAPLRDGASESLAYRKLFEYASSFQPLAVAETRIADWYAKELVKLNKKNQRTATITAEYVAIIRARLESADKDIKRTQGDSNANGLIPLALLRKGEVLKKLALLNIGDFEREEAESAFQSALQMQKILGTEKGEDGFARFHYALFLVDAYGIDRANDIRELIVAFTQGGVINSAVENFFQNARSQVGLETQKHGLAFMASIAPDFKAYLVSLGWTQTDFAL